MSWLLIIPIVVALFMYWRERRISDYYGSLCNQFEYQLVVMKQDRVELVDHIHELREAARPRVIFPPDYIGGDGPVDIRA